MLYWLPTHYGFTTIINIFLVRGTSLDVRIWRVFWRLRSILALKGSSIRQLFLSGFVEQYILIPISCALFRVIICLLSHLLFTYIIHLSLSGQFTLCNSSKRSTYICPNPGYNAKISSVSARSVWSGGVQKWWEFGGTLPWEKIRLLNFST